MRLFGDEVICCVRQPIKRKSRGSINMNNTLGRSRESLSRLFPRTIASHTIAAQVVDIVVTLETIICLYFFFNTIHNMIGAPKRALIVEMGNAYVPILQSISQISKIFAPIKAEAGIVKRWLLVANTPRAICGTATPINAIGPQNAVTLPANKHDATTIIQRVRSTLMPSPRA